MKLSFREVNLDDWNKFERSYDGSHVFQGIERVNKRSKMGYNSYVVGVFDGKSLIAGGVMLGRKSEFWMAYGPLIDWDNHDLVKFFLDKVDEFAAEKGIIRLEIFPNLLLATRTSKGQIIESWNRDELINLFKKCGFSYEGLTVNYEMKAGRWAFTKDLTGIKNQQDLRLTYRKTLRARLRQTEGQVEIQRLDRDHLGTLIGLIDESDAHNNIKNRELEYYRKMYDNFGSNVKFMVAVKSDDKTPIAGAIFIYHGTEVASYLSGMDRQYRNLNGRAWLQDFVMSEAIENDIARVNFFWVEGKFDNNHLLEFKSGFGGVVEEYIGGFDKVYSPVKFITRKFLRKGRGAVRRLRQIPSRFRH